MQNEDRRRIPRFGYDTRVEIKIYPSGERGKGRGKECTCRTGDLSGHGMRLVTDTEIAVNTPIDMLVFVHDPPSAYTLSGEVRWVSREEPSLDYSIGIEFTGGSKTHRESWENLVQMLAAVPAAI